MGCYILRRPYHKETTRDGLNELINQEANFLKSLCDRKEVQDIQTTNWFNQSLKVDLINVKSALTSLQDYMERSPDLKPYDAHWIKICEVLESYYCMKDQNFKLKNSEFQDLNKSNSFAEGHSPVFKSFHEVYQSYLIWYDDNMKEKSK
jgi:hypothetical protein